MQRKVASSSSFHSTSILLKLDLVISYLRRMYSIVVSDQCGIFVPPLSLFCPPSVPFTNFGFPDGILFELAPFLVKLYLLKGLISFFFKN
jgi:hypothetical protein